MLKNKQGKWRFLNCSFQIWKTNFIMSSLRKQNAQVFLVHTYFILIGFHRKYSLFNIFKWVKTKVNFFNNFFWVESSHVCKFCEQGFRPHTVSKSFDFMLNLSISFKFWCFVYGFLVVFYCRMTMTTHHLQVCSVRRSQDIMPLWHCLMIYHSQQNRWLFFRFC